MAPYALKPLRKVHRPSVVLLLAHAPDDEVFETSGVSVPPQLQTRLTLAELQPSTWYDETRMRIRKRKRRLMPKCVEQLYRYEEQA